jgi:hypothetical protein
MFYHRLNTTKSTWRQLLPVDSDDTEVTQFLAMPINVDMKFFAAWSAMSPLKLRKSTKDSVIEQFCGPPSSNSSLSWDVDANFEGSEFESPLRTFISRSKLRQDTFFITLDGYMGLGPQGMMVGDEMCSIPGCDYPLAIRRAPRKRKKTNEHVDGEEYQLLGACYVYGMMNGEIAAGPKSKEKVRRLVFV